MSTRFSSRPTKGDRGGARLRLPSGQVLRAAALGTCVLLALSVVCLWGMSLVLAVSGGWGLTWAGEGGRAPVGRPAVRTGRRPMQPGDSPLPVVAGR